MLKRARLPDPVFKVDDIVTIWKGWDPLATAKVIQANKRGIWLDNGSRWTPLGWRRGDSSGPHLQPQDTRKELLAKLKLVAWDKLDDESLWEAASTAGVWPLLKSTPA